VLFWNLVHGYYFSNALKCLAMVSMLESSSAVLSDGCQSVLLISYAEHVSYCEYIRWGPLVELRIGFRSKDDVFPFC
jgi:hypothetical protein